MPVDHRWLERIGRDLLIAIGEDPDREGLRDTPRRFAESWREFMTRDDISCTTFNTVHTDQMVVVSGMRVWSMCEHHLMPFWCDVTIGYIANEHVLGLSKFGRIADYHAHRLNMQETLVQSIADSIMRVCNTCDVAVIGHGEHLCMTSRGIKMHARMSTSIMKGAFRDQPEARSEFFHLSRLSRDC